MARFFKVFRGLGDITLAGCILFKTNLSRDALVGLIPLMPLKSVPKPFFSIPKEAFLTLFIAVLRDDFVRFSNC